MPNQALTQTMPLTMSAAGTQVKISAVMGGTGFARKVADMGLNPGAQIEVRQHQGGAVVICAGNTRYALGAGMAHRIMVQPV